MINENDLRHIRNMLISLQRLEDCHNQYSLEEAINDYMVFDVILMEFENLGNQMMKLSDELLNSHPELHLNELRAIRHRIAHDYLSVQIETLYNTIENDFPNVKASLKSLITS